MTVVEMSCWCEISNNSSATFGLLWNQTLTVHWHQNSFSVCATRIWKKKTIKNVDVKKIGNVFISFRAELKLNICFVFTPDRIILLVTRKEAVQCWCGREFSSNVGLAYENFSVVSANWNLNLTYKSYCVHCALIVFKETCVLYFMLQL